MKKIAAVFSFLAIVSMRSCSSAKEDGKAELGLMAIGFIIAALVFGSLAEKSSKNKTP